MKQILSTIGKNMTKNSPVILTGLGVAGLITTTVLAVRATPKALELIDERRMELADEDESFVYGDYDNCKLEALDIIRTTWKCYIPALTMGGITIACIIGANSVNLRRNAALASVYSLSEAALKEYQAKVIDTIGETKHTKIKDEIAKDRIEKNPVSSREVVVTGRGDMLCYDALSGRYFKSDIEHIKKVFNDLGRDMLSDMYISLNDVYYALDLQSTKLGDLVGWHVDHGLPVPSFSSQLAEDNTPCLVLDFSIEPRYNYNK